LGSGQHHLLELCGVETIPKLIKVVLVLKICSAVLRLFTMAALSVGLVGCKVPSNFDLPVGSQWSHGEFRIIVRRAHYLEPIISDEGRGNVTWVKWILVTHQTNHSLQKREFLKAGGRSENWFVLIKDSDYLIHSFGENSALFDPETGKDVSKPFARARLYNRSGTECLTMVNGETVLLDTLSAFNGDPKALARPPWAGTLDKLKFTGITTIYAEDAQHLLLISTISSNLIVDMYSTSGSQEHWSIPLEGFRDADVVDGKVILLTRVRLANGAEDQLRLKNAQGETLSEVIIPAAGGICWTPSQHEVLISSGPEFSTYQVWNYDSNTIRDITFRK
jgi:hypothetical protein